MTTNDHNPIPCEHCGGSHADVEALHECGERHIYDRMMEEDY